MASSEDFRQQLKAGKVEEAFAGALAEAVQLKITTWVAADTEAHAETAAQPGYRLQTQINTIEGAIANEIGDQFIGNGPYRDLLPFHVDQVAHGNQLVENNIKSLQKLFEILIALQRHQTGLSEVDYPSLSLPPQETAAPPDAGIAPIAADLTAQTPELTTQETQEAVVPESTPSPETTTSWEEQDEAEEEDEEDEDDSVLDLLESLPPPPPPPLEEEESSVTEEDVRDEFIEAEAEPEPTPDRPTAELDEEDWQVLNEDWGTLELEELESPPSAEPDIPPQTDIEPTPREPESANKMPSLDSLAELQDTDDDTDWDDWVVDEPELGDRSFAQMETDEDWGDLVEDFDPFAAPPPVEESPSELNIQEDWDEFAVEELEPYSDLTEVDSEIEWSDLSESQTAESSRDPLEGLGALPEESEEKELTSESSDPMDLLGDQNQAAEKVDENVNEPDYEFEELSLEEFSMDDFDPLSHPEEDWQEKPKSTQPGEPPPPPPPSPFQDKHQEP